MPNGEYPKIEDVTDPVTLFLLAKLAINVSHGFVVETPVEAIRRLLADRDNTARILERTTRDLVKASEQRDDANRTLRKIRKLTKPDFDDIIQSIKDKCVEFDALVEANKNR